MKRWMLVLAACGTARADKPAATDVQPLDLVGPTKTLAAACKTATPCGGTDLDDKTEAIIKPPKTPDCSAVLDVGNDPNTRGGDKPPKMVLAKDGGEIRIASVTCAVPKGIRSSEQQYYAFLKRADGWWRTTKPLWEISYNDRYCGAEMVTRWNDRGARTFLGVAVTTGCVACNKQGNEDQTIEMMLRFELGSAKPLVYGPLVVGERYKQQGMPDAAPDVECKTINEHISMDEAWSGDDDLTLKGPASWYSFDRNDRGVHMWLNTSKKAPSSAGTYHFVH